MVKVFDEQGNERSWDWLVQEFGVGVRVDPRPDLTAAGFEVTELHAKSGPCTLVASVRKAPTPDTEVARWWDDASPANVDLPADLATWHPRGVYGAVNGTGDIGFGMGQGDWYDQHWAPDHLPVSEIWCEGNSGRVHGLGWIGGTDHLHLDTVFEWLVGGDPPPPPGDGDLARAIREAGHEIAAAILTLAGA